jgi:hypothetical protein
MTWAQSMKYQELVAQGMPRDQAFKIAYPNGLQSPEDIKKQEAKAAQGQGLAQVGGMVGGLVGARYGMNKFDQWMNPGKEAATNTAVTGAGSATNAAGTVPSGEILSATRVPGQGLTNALSAQGAPQATATATEVQSLQNGNTLLSNGMEKTPSGDLIDPNSGQKIGQAVQGALGAWQIITAAQQWKEGDKLGAGLNAAGGTANIGAAIYGSGSSAASAAGYINPALGAYQGYKTAQMIGDAPSGGKRNTQGAIGGAASGAAIGSVGGPIGTGIGAVVGGTLGFLGSYFGSSKDKYQMMRDKAREIWQKNGILDKDYKGTLADGSTFDFGKDGKKAGKLNTTDPNWGKIAALANVVAAGEGVSGKAGEAIATLYTNAALSNAGGSYEKALANIRHFSNQRQQSPDQIKQTIQSLYDNKKITEDQYKTWTNDVTKIYAPQKQNFRQSLEQKTKG